MGVQKIIEVCGLPQELCAKEGKMKSEVNEINRQISELMKIMDFLPFACAIIDENLHIKQINYEMSEFLGLSAEGSQENALITNLLPKDEAASFIDFVRTTPASKSEIIWHIFRFKGKRGDSNQLLLSKLKEPEGHSSHQYSILLGIPMTNIHLETATDSLDRQKDQNDVLSKKYKNIFNNTIIGIIIFDNDHCIEEVNQTFADQFNVRRQDVIGKNIEKIFSSNLDKKLQDLLKKINKDKYPIVKEVITIQNEFKEHAILEISLSKFRTFINSSEKNMMIVEDITQKKETQEALIQSEKLALTGRLAASLAHEINNPLQASIGCLGLVDEMLDEDERKEDLGIYINMAMDELKRGARIVRKLRDLHRKSDPSEKSPIDLKKMIDDVLILAKNQLYDRNIVPVFLYQGSPPIIMGVRDQIQSVILNIVINAIDVMPEGGYIYVDLDLTEETEGVKVKIRDTGTGMDKNIMDHLFNPFFTTKEEGVGLGLYLCNEIINNHNGYIEVDSEVGKGTIFSIWLPKGDCPEEEDYDK